MAKLPPVYHHTGLESSGGATRVARLIMDGLAERGVEANLSFELGEGPDAAAVLPEDLGRYLPKNVLPHIHCTADWPALLGSIPPRRAAVVTLHDAELLTGGCPYPLDCPHYGRDCADPCPRQFPDSAQTLARKRAQLVRLSPVLVAPSQWLAKLARARFDLPVTVVPNGVPWPGRPHLASRARKQLGINPVARVTLFVAHGGMDAGYKSGSAWRGLWTRIKAAVPEALCYAVGGDNAGRQDDDLVVWPYVERDRLALLMAAADVLLYPTRADNHSLVILEAMSQGLPTVAYAVGGVPEQVVHGRTGLLVPPNDEDQFVSLATQLLQNHNLSRALGLAAFAMGQRNFTNQRMVNDYVRLYGKAGGSE